MQVAVQEFLGKAIMADRGQAIIMLLAAAAVQMLSVRMPAGQVVGLAETEKHHPYSAAHMQAAVAAAAHRRALLAGPAAAAMVRQAATAIREPVPQILVAAQAALHLNVVAEFSALLAALV